jgi:hypothetical protein
MDDGPEVSEVERRVVWVWPGGLIRCGGREKERGRSCCSDGEPDEDEQGGRAVHLWSGGALCMAKVVFHGLRVLTAVAVDYSVDYFQKGRPKPFLPRSLT